MEYLLLFLSMHGNRKRQWYEPRELKKSRPQLSKTIANENVDLHILSFFHTFWRTCYKDNGLDQLQCPICLEIILKIGDILSFWLSLTAPDVYMLSYEKYFPSRMKAIDPVLHGFLLTRSNTCICSCDLWWHACEHESVRFLVQTHTLTSDAWFWRCASQWFPTNFGV